jgi:hypothetical protein
MVSPPGGACGRRALVWSAALLAAWPAGCERGPKLVPVNGQATVDGEPLTTGTLVLKPDRDKGNTSPLEPAGMINPDGTFRVYTNYKPGAPVGAYKVGVQASVPINPGAEYPTYRSLIDKRYNDAATSGLTLDVVERPAPGAYDLRLNR